VVTSLERGGNDRLECSEHALFTQVLLERGAYASGTAGQAITFASYGAAAVVLAVRLAGRFLKPEE
jgi:hypothetical protein